MGYEFWLGAIVGGGLIHVCWYVDMTEYRQALKFAARNGMCEKLDDGEYYFLVHEDKFYDLQRRAENGNI